MMPPVYSLPQLYSDLIHATVVLAVVVAATVLRYSHTLDATTVGNVYTAAVGYAAGRSGSVAHSLVAARQADRTGGL